MFILFIDAKLMFITVHCTSIRLRLDVWFVVSKYIVNNKKHTHKNTKQKNKGKQNKTKSKNKQKHKTNNKQNKQTIKQFVLIRLISYVLESTGLWR